MAALANARAAGLLRSVDLGLAATLHSLDGRGQDTLGLLVALLSHATGEGNVCIALQDIADQCLQAEGSEEPLIRVPGLTVLLKVLQESPVVGRPGDRAPLVLEDGRLYLGRYWWYEQQVAEALLQRAASDIDKPRPEVGEAFRQLFPVAGTGGCDWQAVAAALALHRKLVVISGGPGTGKTHTVTAILALLLGQAGTAPLRIRLAAPTGKAAARLTESIRQARGGLAIDEALRDHIPDEAMTLHRLIGIRPGSAPVHHAGNLLPVDVMVVDEASMIDLPMMAKLLSALPAQARLILLGDKDQLASVEAGSVFADITGDFGDTRCSPAMMDSLQAFMGTPLLLVEGSDALADTVVLLRQSWRFGKDSGIGGLAARVNAGDAGAGLALLDSGDPDVVRHHLAAQDLPANLHARTRDWLDSLFAADDPGTALGILSRFRILCAVRRGPWGVEQVNRCIEALLRSRGIIAGRGDSYRGRPVMITRNDPALGLFNGDVGILWPAGKGGELRAWFMTADGSLRSLSPARLPAHETTWAMTVHKSQGSEFDRVLLVLPEQDSPVLTRELLYTGITRARTAVELWVSEQAFQRCVARQVRRVSGLQQKLHGSDDQ